MKALLYLGLGVTGLFLVVVVIAFFLPARYEVTRDISIQAPAEVVFPLVGDLRSWKDWTVWNRRDPDMLISYEGDTAAAGGIYRWTSEAEGSGQMTVLSVEPGKSIRYDLSFEGFDMVSQGSVTLRPAGENLVVVTWTDTGELGLNPLYRYFGLFLDSMIGADFEAGLLNLKAEAEAAAEAMRMDNMDTPAA